MKNTNKVPKKQWVKWSCRAKAVFNEVYHSIKSGYRTLYPPTAQKLPKQAIGVMAWNTAWIAADAANEH